MRRDVVAITLRRTHRYCAQIVPHTRERFEFVPLRQQTLRDGTSDRAASHQSDSNAKLHRPPRS
jgi:hypothetical protein